MKVKEESEKVGLKLNIQKTKIMASGPTTSWEIDGETVETMPDFILWGLQNHCRWWLQPRNYYYFLFYFILLYDTVLVLPYINMNLPRVYTCSPSWSPLPSSSPYHPSGSSQCTSPKHPVSCIKPGLVVHFLYDIIHVSMPFSQIIPPSPSPTESKRLFYTSVSLLLSHIQGYHYHLSKFHIYVLVYCIGIFLPGLLHSV